MHLAGERPAGNLGASLGKIDAVLAHGEAPLQGEGSLVADRFGQGLALCRPIEEASEARSVQRDIAAERLPAGGIGDGAIERQFGPSGKTGAQIVEQQRTLSTRHLDADTAHRLAAEARLIEIEVDLAIGVLWQRRHHGEDEVACRLEWASGAFLRLRDAIKIEPARGQSHLDVQRLCPCGGCRAADELRLADTLEGEGDIVEAQALGVAGNLRFEIDERGFCLAGAAGHCLGGRWRSAARPARAPAWR